MSYGWPVRPFGRQHPVRGFLNDPRISGDSRAFHFGIDVSAPDGTPVHAVKPGRVHRPNPLTAAVVSPDGTTMAYWHIDVVVRHRQQVGLHDLLGHVAAGWGHVHLGERATGGAWRNPLREGGITPFAKGTRPTIAAVQFRRGLRPLPSDQLKGLVDIWVEAFDTTPRRVPPPWDDLPVAPSLVRWRVLRRGPGTVVKPWKIGVDLRRHLPERAFHVVYTPEARQNRPGEPGVYLYHLAQDWATGAFPNGRYVIELEALDVRGNAKRRRFGFAIANGT